MEKTSEIWAPTSVKSVFKLSLAPSTTGSGNRPTAVGAGTQYTAVCGLGWRFSFRVDQQSAQTVVDTSGNTIESFQLQLFFDPHLVYSSSYGTITLVTQVQNLISASPPVPITTHLPSNGYHPTLGTYVYLNGAATPSISIELRFSTELGLTLWRPVEHVPRMQTALRDTLGGKELVDVKFYAFSRTDSGRVTHPLPLYASTALMRGFSGDLDAFLTTAHGFSEAKIVDLDLHEPEETSFEDYGYASDSDLDSDSELDSDGEENPPSVREDADGMEVSTQVVPGRKSSGREGRVIVLKDTAFKTWKAFIFYLYTRQVNFRPLKSQGLPQSTTNDPSCSPKSMYRLAEKFGLEDLKALALSSISSSLSETNILPEVFSAFTALYAFECSAI
ncbi:hypothetical protein C8R46DRAFT_1108599 [Mycena filopes]|nr:hypothetical protein C8R46DRAFT_1108599 [Mycena filopes]